MNATRAAARPLLVGMLAGLAAVCTVTSLLVLAVTVYAFPGEPLVALAMLALDIPLAWCALVIAGTMVVAARCHVTVAEGALTALCVTPSRAQIPLFHEVRLVLADIASVEHGEQMTWTPWAPEIRQCAWVTMADGARHIIASARGVGGGSLPIAGAATLVASAAGVVATLRPNAPFHTVGLYGGARLVGGREPGNGSGPVAS
jgi:hypothetical protein